MMDTPILIGVFTVGATVAAGAVVAAGAAGAAGAAVAAGAHAVSSIPAATAIETRKNSFFVILLSLNLIVLFFIYHCLPFIRLFNFHLLIFLWFIIR
jgi:hypothetical protein